MKNIKNERLNAWMKANRFNCNTLTKALNEQGASLTPQAVWEQVVNGRVPYADSMEAFDKLIRSMGQGMEALSLFEGMRKK